MVSLLSSYNRTIHSEVSLVGDLVKDALSFVKENEIKDEDILFEIKVILNELILNAIKHGNKHSAEKVVELTVSFADHKHIHIIVKDEGEGHDYRCIMNQHTSFVTAPDICDMKETGRGIFIVKSLAESLKFNEKGNVITAVIAVV